MFMPEIQNRNQPAARRQHPVDAKFIRKLGAANRPDAPYFIAHNAAFDLGFLWRRCIVLGLRPPFPLPGPNARAGKDYGCTMQAWAGYRERVSLQALCRALSLPDPKAEGTGAQAWQWWKAGDVERVATYCAGDVRAVRDIWHRVSAMAGGLTA